MFYWMTFDLSEACRRSFLEVPGIMEPDRTRRHGRGGIEGYV
jgi:hypothetical protein